jgi:hypothetical protein
MRGPGVPRPAPRGSRPTSSQYRPEWRLRGGMARGSRPCRPSLLRSSSRSFPRRHRRALNEAVARAGKPTGCVRAADRRDADQWIDRALERKRRPCPVTRPPRARGRRWRVRRRHRGGTRSDALRASGPDPTPRGSAGVERDGGHGAPSPGSSLSCSAQPVPFASCLGVTRRGHPSVTSPLGRSRTTSIWSRPRTPPPSPRSENGWACRITR